MPLDFVVVDCHDLDGMALYKSGYYSYTKVTPLACSVNWLAETQSRGMNSYRLVIACAYVIIIIIMTVFPFHIS